MKAQWNVSIALLAFMVAPAQAIDFEVLFVDPPGQGFNSTEPFTGHGSNKAKTLGEARKNVLFRAVDMVRSQVHGSGTILWKVKFQEIEGYGAMTLGPAFRELTQLPSAAENTSGFSFEVGRHYPSTLTLALTSRLRNYDDYSAEDAETSFSKYGSYYGYDTKDPNHSFISVVLHELVHVLGFADIKCLTNCFPAATSKQTHFSRLVFGENKPVDQMSIDEMLPFYLSGNKLWFKGSEHTRQAALSKLTGGHTDGHLHLHAEQPFEGQNGTHFAPQMYPAQMMYSAGANTTELGMAAYVLCDIGWCAGKGFVQDVAVELEVGAGPVFSNEKLTLTGVVHNTSDMLLPKPEVELQLPANLQLSELSDGCVLKQNILLCSYDQLAAGQKQQFSVTVNPAKGQYAFYGRAYARDYVVDPNGVNNIIDFSMDVVERQPLTVNAGADLQVNAKTEVRLMAHAEGGLGRYQFQWQQISGPAVSLDIQENTAKFNAPDVSTMTELTFKSQVSDGQNTQTDEIKVTVKPVAVAQETSKGESGGAFSFASVMGLAALLVFRSLFMGGRRRRTTRH